MIKTTFEVGLLSIFFSVGICNYTTHFYQVLLKPFGSASLDMQSLCKLENCTSRGMLLLPLEAAMRLYARWAIWSAER